MIEAMVWARRFHDQGVLHLAAGEDIAAQASARMIVRWHAEHPVAISVSASFEHGAPIPALAGSLSLPESHTAHRPASVSLVICTRDRPAQLARCLASLSEQTRPPDEMIVVDNASITTETKEVCRAAGVIYVREPRPGLDIARNTGARASACKIIAYTDDDVVLHPSWLERTLDAFDAPHISAVTGLVLPAELATPAQWHFERYWGFGRGVTRKDFDPAFLEAHRDYGCPAWEIGAGASMAFRREVFEQVGFFDERLDVGAAGCSGDSEFWHRILCAGGTCRYDPSVVAFHFHRQDWDGLRKQIRAYMRGHAAALLVQFERSHLRGNLKRLVIGFPHFYAKRALRHVLCKRSDEDLLTREEVSGLLSGIWFYLSMPRGRDTR